MAERDKISRALGRGLCDTEVFCGRESLVYGCWEIALRAVKVRGRWEIMNFYFGAHLIF